VEVRIDRHVVAEALRRGEKGVKLDLFDRALFRGTSLATADRFEHLLVGERVEPFGDPRLLLQKGEVRSIIDDL